MLRSSQPNAKEAVTSARGIRGFKGTSHGMRAVLQRAKKPFRGRNEIYMKIACCSVFALAGAAHHCRCHETHLPTPLASTTVAILGLRT
jgi:hypothetical protein